MAIQLDAQFVADYRQLQRDQQLLREQFEQRVSEELARRQRDVTPLQHECEALRQELDRRAAEAVVQRRLDAAQGQREREQLEHRLAEMSARHQVAAEQWQRESQQLRDELDRRAAAELENRRPELSAEQSGAGPSGPEWESLPRYQEAEEQLQQLRASLRQEQDLRTMLAAQLEVARAAADAAVSQAAEAESRHAQATQELEQLHQGLAQQCAENTGLRRQLKQAHAAAAAAAKKKPAPRITLTTGAEEYAELSGEDVACTLDAGTRREARPARPGPLDAIGAGSAVLPNNPQQLQRMVQESEAARGQLAKEKRDLERVVLSLRRELEQLKHGAG